MRVRAGRLTGGVDGMKAGSKSAARANDKPRMVELQQNAQHVAALLKAMANPARLVILCQLMEGECSVGALERAVGLSQSAISQHLAVLREGEVVGSRRDGQTVFYSLANADVATLMATLHSVFCSEPARLKARAA